MIFYIKIPTDCRIHKSLQDRPGAPAGLRLPWRERPAGRARSRYSGGGSPGWPRAGTCCRRRPLGGRARCECASSRGTARWVRALLALRPDSCIHGRRGGGGACRGGRRACAPRARRWPRLKRGPADAATPHSRAARGSCGRPGTPSRWSGGQAFLPRAAPRKVCGLSRRPRRRSWPRGCGPGPGLRSLGSTRRDRPPCTTPRASSWTRGGTWKPSGGAARSWRTRPRGARQTWSLAVAWSRWRAWRPSHALMVSSWLPGQPRRPSPSSVDGWGSVSVSDTGWR